MVQQHITSGGLHVAGREDQIRQLQTFWGDHGTYSATDSPGGPLVLLWTVPGGPFLGEDQLKYDRPITLKTPFYIATVVCKF